jgi:PAS domain S-box-containing protein
MVTGSSIEAALRKSEERLSQLQVATMAGIWEWDLDTDAAQWTAEMESLYGYPPHSVTTYKDWSRRVLPEDLPRIEAERSRAIAEHRPFELEFRILHPQRAIRWLSSRGGAIYDESGRPRRVLGLSVDVTERKQLEEARRDADQKSDFLAMLSHELRNPLMPIRNSLCILERAEPGGELASRAVAVIDRQVSHLSRLVDDLLDVTRIARGKVQLRREPLELGELVRRTAEDHRAAFADGGICFTPRVSTEPMWLNADATRIAQVIGNLLGNAAKFTPRGGSVTLTLDREGGAAVLAVRDDGVGIVPEVLPQIFEPFSQAAQTLDRTRGGLGLGLALVKGFVELHGGAVDATSEGPGRGAEFTIRLPLALTPGERVSESAPHPASSRRILVIEDNVDAADSLKDVLELEGHDVRVAYDGPTGLNVARAFNPRVVLCDIGLPGMSGYQVAQAFHRDPDLRSAVLVALTGYAQAEDRKRASEAGFAFHVAKPPSLDDLDRLIQAAP